MTDQDFHPGLTPGHLGAPVLEPEGRPPGAPRPRPDAPDPHQRRNGLACGLTAFALVAVFGGAGVAGWTWVQGQRKPSAAVDYAGQGTDSVQVSVPEGAGLSQIASALVRNGVVASSLAFTRAAKGSAAAGRIQPGTYTLKQKMSAAAALSILIDPANANGLTIPEGWRGSQIYTAIDKKLNLPEGTTERTAKERAAELGLPEFAKGSPEGYLFPATYSVTDGTTAADLLKQMIERAGKEFSRDNADIVAQTLGQSLYGLVTVASMVEGEADNTQDMGRVARVIYNRLAKGMPLQLDSTINYALGRSTLNTTVTDTRLDSPYNTYLHPGLPPSPISNPGRQAIMAALDPAQGDWLYFVTVKPGDTRFTDNLEMHQRNVVEFNANRAAPASAAAAAPSAASPSAASKPAEAPAGEGER
ncbi:endolytic transglycosylase MltG [Kitasatospora aureofaciens]|uniref:endolytic transglycosylase MltG n=1 Tax=Kitasatospora aureofaciens TaxID=1894 RepID=UPI001C453615|nr:endolytic transglycosylase MltG [Kitasatospora aureofaciens]MBV6698271.1 endolytic transglycosylase MltG [Kitasatospora aureofaciens]